MEVSKIFRRSLVLLFLMAFVGGLAQKSQAQYFNFGKNRVQYDEFNWRYIQSEHFDVYYYSSQNYDLANFSAYALEAALEQLKQDFDHQIADRIQVIIYDSHNDFSQTNVVPLPVEAEGIGGVTDPYKNRITMPFNGDFTDFRQVLHHELVHAVINDMFYGGNVQSRLSGNALQIPLWFNEGMAEFTSLGWDTETDMYIRDATINNYLPAIPRLSGFLAYRGGQSVWNYIEQEYGRQKITEIMQTLKTTRSLELTFSRTLGQTLKEFSEQWSEYYRKRYLPEVDNREKITNFSDPLTGENQAYDTSPAISPEGDKIAMITRTPGYSNVVVISAITGEKIKTLIEGQGNLNFEELNILNPNLTWSPDGEKLALSTKSEGEDHLAIVDYNTGNVQMIEFPKLDAIGSVSWAPNGNKIAFDGNIGPFQDIYVYNLKTEDFNNLTNDVISDFTPTWGADSQTIYFTSTRGDEVALNTIKNTSRLLMDKDLYSTDIYAAEVGDAVAQRLTKTPTWNEKQPATTRDGKLFYISDESGIPNVYQMNLQDRTTTPLTNLQTGVMQMSISADASRMAVNSINEGNPDVFMIRAPMSRKKDGPLERNQWAKRRAQESQAERVPATEYVREMLTQNALDSTSLTKAVASKVNPKPKEAVVDTLASAKTDTSQMAEAKQDTGSIDFRNYVFSSEVQEDSAFKEKYLDASKFELENNKTEDGRYVPNDYRLKFSTDLVYAGGNFSTAYGTYGITQIQFSDLLGNHQISFGSNLNLDLRNSTYFLQYGYLKGRTDWLFNFFHNSTKFQSFSGQLYRFRSYGGAINARYPFDKFRRLDVSVSMIGLAQDYTIAYSDSTRNRSSSFSYPQVTFTSDKTVRGRITPTAGSRYAVSLSGSPSRIGGSPQFASLLGDFRKYIDLGSRYSFALRGSGAVSFGHEDAEGDDSQSFFMGGMRGWINQRYSGRGIPLDQLGDTFFTQPALPLRGHPYNATYGDKFTLLNAEFRFPLFAAILPGPIPILPLYNLTGVAFMDAGMAWGKEISYLPDGTNINDDRLTNPASLEFEVQEQRNLYIDRSNGNISETRPPDYEDNQQQYLNVPANQGDILMGAGFGLRTILFGFPLRYDVGWPYYQNGFDSDPIHYITIGIDF